jgi:hypothetical protein
VIADGSSDETLVIGASTPKYASGISALADARHDARQLHWLKGRRT